MSSKKRSRPLFEVPVEIGSSRESGWVYRSDAGKEEPPHHEEPPRGAYMDTNPELGLVTLGTQACALAMATAATTFLLSVTMAALPFTISFRVLDSLNDLQRRN